MPTRLDPVPLDEIASRIRDEAWVDLRVVGVGTVQRVLITQLNVHRDHDEVVVRQKFAASDDELTVEEHAFDAEDIRWLRETQVALCDVKPVQPPAPESVQCIDAKSVVNRIIRSVCFVYEKSEAELRGGWRAAGATRERQRALWLAFEMTDLTPPQICKDHFGYGSQQPILTVRAKIEQAVKSNGAVHYNETPGAWLIELKQLAGLVDKHFGIAYRRQSPSPSWTVYL